MIPPIEPLSPFEVFRTPIIVRRFTQGFYLNGVWQEGSQIILSQVLQAGNVFNLVLNNTTPIVVPFTTNLSTTMGIIKASIENKPSIQQCDISSDNLTITIVPLQPNISMVNSCTVTGGPISVFVTILNSPTYINATASVQPTRGKDVILVPEGRRDSETYKMFTSLEIQGITTQNPDQVMILKPPFTELVFEVIQIREWQNNSNFNIVNHYSYIAMRLHPLPQVG